MLSSKVQGVPKPRILPFVRPSDKLRGGYIRTTHYVAVGIIPYMNTTTHERKKWLCENVGPKKEVIVWKYDYSYLFQLFIHLFIYFRSPNYLFCEHLFLFIELSRTWTQPHTKYFNLKLHVSCVSCRSARPENYDVRPSVVSVFFLNCDWSAVSPRNQQNNWDFYFKCPNPIRRMGFLF